MPKRRLTGALLLGLAVGLPALSLPAQSADSSLPADSRAPHLIPRTSAERQQRYLTQHRIILNVRVADGSGKPDRDLNQADFTVFDNDQPRNLVSFRSVEGLAAQAHVVIVLDAVNNPTRQVRSFGKAVEKFLSAGDGPLPLAVSLGVFANDHIEFNSLSQDRAALLAEFRSRAANLHATGCIAVPEHDETVDTSGILRGGMHATPSAALACLNDRFVASLSALNFLANDQINIPGRAIVIWMGPGWPLLTNKEFTPDPPPLKENFFDQLVEVSTALREAQVTLDAVASPDQDIRGSAISERGFDFFEGIASPEQVRAGNLGLHALAHQTGGNIVADEHDISGQLRQCFEDAESYYVLAFDAPAAAAFGEYHTLGIKVDKPGLNVRANTLYYAEQ